MATVKRLIDEFALRIPIGEALALRPDTRVNNTDDDIFSCSCMRSCAGWTAQLIPKTACARKPEEARRRRCVDVMGSSLSPPGRPLFPERRGLFRREFAANPLKLIA